MVLGSLPAWLLSPFSASGQTAANTTPAKPTSRARFGTGPTPFAVLLPPRGGSFDRAAECVLAGIKAAHSIDGAEVSVEAFESLEDPAGLAATLTSLRERGVKFVIGPLTRNGANSVRTLDSVEVPTLVLNLPEGDLPARAGSRAVYFGLAIETESRQAAAQAFAQGLALDGGRKPRAVMIVADNRLAVRSAVAFTEEWQSLGGELSDPIEFAGDRPPRDLRARLGTPAPDVAFLAMTPEQARGVRRELAPQMLAWGTSQVSIGNSRSLRLPELEGLRVLEMPWHVEPEHPAVMAYPKAPAHYSVEMQRLYALGIDAFRVARQMNAGGASFELDGVTGRLRYDSQGLARIDRVSVAAQYRGGRPMPIKGPAGAN